MRKIREVLRLRFEAGLSARRVAESLQVARSTVGEYERRFAAAGLAWPLPASLSDTELERRLFPPPPAVPADSRPLPDWAEVHQELRRPGVTLMLLWEEYRAAHPQGFAYSWFCEHYRAWAGKLDVVMRQTHRAGEKLFVDYAGQTVDVLDRASGQIHPAQVFVAVLGASNYTYAEATWTQTLRDWIGAHVRAFEFFGGVTEVVIPDNLKSGVARACRYEPDLNPTYAELASHYGTAIIPARARRPRDKAKVEAGVQAVERMILAALRPLPATPYVYATWKKVRVHIDYHVEVEGHYYSVPYALVKQALEVRLTDKTVECFHKGQRVASHLRSHLKGRHTTLPGHMPKAHREYAQWTPQRLVQWAEKTGPATAGVVAHILAHRPHPQQGFRSCLGILRLGERYGTDRLEAACRRALHLNACRYKSIESILRRGLDRQPLSDPQEVTLPDAHEHLRGPHYYH